MTILRPALLLCAGFLVACASVAVDNSVDQVIEQPAVSTTSPPASETTASETTISTASTASQETTTVTEANAEAPPNCRAIASFDDDAANAQWLVVNDNVMGGRSSGDRTFADNTMTFSGAINTDGGGFASLRLPLAPQTLVAADRIVFRARADGRSYVVTFDDSVNRLDSRVSFRAPIAFEGTGGWETVTVLLTDLFPASFGRPVDAEPFRQDLATRMGIMLSDGIDGEFSLEIDSIEVCVP